ncbi:hypothetical protein HMPREF9554_00969 [Treponema phagedenis F0421]|nr:hypothetical protein HMPREF9554_00969 [Treponema phagedenis F0421]
MAPILTWPYSKRAVLNYYISFCVFIKGMSRINRYKIFAAEKFPLQK